MSSIVNKELQAIQNLQLRVKEVFTEEILKSSTFAKELYKQVRNNAKKLDDVINVEQKLKVKGFKATDEQIEKVNNKDSYIQTVKLSLDVFELYKRTDYTEAQKAAAEREAKAAIAAAAEAAASVLAEESKKAEIAPSEEKRVEEVETTSSKGVENKVVECSIQPEAKAEVKKVAAGSPAAPHEPVTGTTHQVKLLVKDHTTSLEEALRLVTPLFTLLPQAVTFLGPHPLFLQKSRLSLLETQLLSSFHFILTNGADQTVEDRLKRVEGELLKLVQSGLDPSKGD